MNNSMTWQTINPATGDPIKSHELTPMADALATVQQCGVTFRDWRRHPFAERAQRMTAIAALLRRNASACAKLMAREMGKPIQQGEAEVEKCAWVCEYFAENAENFLQPQPIRTEAARSYVAFQPLGVILAVMPWNFPFWQVFRCAAPALMAGNAILLKHASNVPECALAIEQLFRDAGFPPGLFATVLIKSESVADLIASPQIAAVTLTGSVPAGRAIAAKAGSHLKKTVMELGGSDPYIVLEDCDLEFTVETCVKARLVNSGQSCIAAKRFIVVDAIREAFAEQMVAKMEAAPVGNPLEAETMIGPLARADLRDELQGQVERSVSQGAKLLTGGRLPEGKGWYYPPTVLTHVQKGMPVYEEETFGPVAAIIGVKDEAEAIRIANDTVFGLGAAVFTQDAQSGERIAHEELEAGCCVVNDFVKSDPRLPFGGIKQSGYGRELSAFGIREFVNIKTVVVGKQRGSRL